MGHCLMAIKSEIEWTDATWNPVRGCTKISPGCKHCYAETFAERFRGVAGHPYERGFDLRLVPEKLAEPLRWKVPRHVFVNSMSDLYAEAACYGAMALTPRHTYQVLTKRPARRREFMTWAWEYAQRGTSEEADVCIQSFEDLAHPFEFSDARAFDRLTERPAAL